MKYNYLIYILVILSILFSDSIINLINNFTSNFFLKNNNIEIKLLEEKNKILISEYQNLLDFKNNIKFEYNYTICNILKDNYGFGNYIINGDNYSIGDEVINEKGLIGIISKINNKTAEVKKIYNTNLIVKINNETGKIVSKDKNNNLIVKEISNYNDVSLNDLVYSINNTYIGKIIKIKYDILDNYLTVKTIDIDNIKYVAVISR
ncbi:MAG: rod shape-determining protein MreC [Bacilli bacterium]|nr:rod shape-determining protein MreC [Bacilli bacterium]MDD4407069.1 rod shape-determining protein MreC [Bacilli bacterium]